MSGKRSSIAVLALAVICAMSQFAYAHDRDEDGRARRHAAQVGERPFYLVDGMDEGRLKDKLEQCKDGPFYRSDFSISHRGAPLQLPEHSLESYTAAARMGAGIIECDVSFTKDGELVCRHSECDLHTTTDIVATDLNNSCTVPWAQGVAPKCCTSDITLAEYKTLRAKMDASDPDADTPEGYLGGTADWRTDLYTGRGPGNVVTLREHIKLLKRWGVSHTPELKSGDPARIAEVFGSQEKYAQKLIDTYKEEGVDPRKVYAQSFNPADVLYWIKREPAFGKQAVFLDAAAPILTDVQLNQLKQEGVRYIAPPIYVLLAVTPDGKIIPSAYAEKIKARGFKIITWSFERDNLTKGAAGNQGYYAFDPLGLAIKKDSDMYKALDVLAKKVGVEGVFSDWPGTVTYYANCMGL